MRGPNTMHSGSCAPEAEPRQHLEDALQDLGFAVKSLQLYPPASPIVKEAVQRSCASLTPLLDDGYLTLEVTPKLLRRGDVEIGPGRAVVEQLAKRLHRHGIARLHFDVRLEESSLQRLAELIATDYQKLDAKGGLRVVFHEDRPTGIHAEFLELDRLFDDDAEEVEDIWEALLNGFQAAADVDDIDWDSLVNSLDRLQEFVAWVAAHVDEIAERTGYENIDVFRFVVERIGGIAATLSDEHVNFLVLAVRRIFDQVDPDTLVDLLADPLEIEIEAEAAEQPTGMSLSDFLGGEPGRPRAEGTSDEGEKRTIDITQIIACGLEPMQAEQLILHTMSTRERSSTRLYGLFSRLMEGQEDRIPVARRVQSFLEQEIGESEGDEGFLEMWPRLSDVLEGEAPDRFVSQRYQMTLQRLLADDSLAGAWPVDRISPRLSEMRPEFVVQRKALVIADLLSIENDDDQYAKVAADLEAALHELVVHDQYGLALQLLHTLDEHAEDTSEKTDSQRQLAGQIFSRFYEPMSLQQLLRDALGKPGPRMDQVVEIVQLGGTDIVPTLLDTLAEEDVRRVRQRLLRILTALGTSVTEIAAGRLDDERWFFVRNLVLLLGDSGDESQIEKIAPLLEHSEARVRTQALEAVVKLGGEKASALLVAAIDDDDEMARTIAVHGLGFHRSGPGIKKLRELLRLPNFRGRNSAMIRTAAIALGRLADADSKQRLLRLARKPWVFAEQRREAQEAAAWALLAVEGSRVGQPPELPVLRHIRPPGRSERRTK